MDVAALSIALSQGNVQQQASISVLKLAMGAAAERGSSIVAMMNKLSDATELSVRPYLGGNLDIVV